MANDPTIVYALTQNWSFTISDSGVIGTRVYLETTAAMPVASTTLPKLGSTWDSDYPFVTLKTITITYINDNDNCGRLFTCSYDGSPYTQTAEPLSSEELPKNVSVTGELVSWEPTKSSYKWLDGVAVAQPVFVQVANAEITVTRVVKDFDAYMAQVFFCTNLCNDSELFGFPEGALMFAGADMTEFKNKMGNKRWKADLKFVARKCQGDIAAGASDPDGWGWTFQLREDTGKWDEPKLQPAGKALYAVTDLTVLFETDSLGDLEDLYETVPRQ